MKSIKAILLTVLLTMCFYIFGSVFSEPLDTDPHKKYGNVTCEKCIAIVKASTILRRYGDGSMIIDYKKTGHLLYIFEKKDNNGIFHYECIKMPKKGGGLVWYRTMNGQ